MKSLLTGFVLLNLCAPITAQEQEALTKIQPNYLWLELGIGAATKPRNPLFIPHFAARFQKSHQQYSFFWSKGFTYDDDDFVERFAEIGVMAGRVAENRWLKASLSAGLSYFESRERGSFDPVSMEYAERWRRSIGLPIEGQLLLTPLPFIGMGLRLMYNPIARNLTGHLLLHGRLGTIRPNEQPGPAYWWAEGYKGSSTLFDGASAYGGGICFLEGRQLFTLKSIFYSNQYADTFDPHAQEYTILYGLADKRRWWMTAFSAGLSYLNGIERGRYRYDQYGGYIEKAKVNNISVPFELRAMFTPFPFAGIGVRAQANFFTNHSYGNVFLTVQIGRLMR